MAAGYMRNLEAVLDPEPPAGPAQPSQRSMLRRGWEVFAEHRLALAGVGFLVFIFLFCFVSPHIYLTHQVSRWRTPTADRAAATCSAVTS